MCWIFKMFKLNKTTHMMILLTFTIVFVVVYMYYMIRDVKKMYADVKRQEQDVISMGKQLQELRNVVGSIMQMGGPVVAGGGGVAVAAAGVAPLQMQSMYAPGRVGQMPSDPTPSAEDDIESVATEDIKKLVEDDEADEAPVSGPEEPVQEATLTPAVPEITESATAAYDEDSLKKLKLEDLKDVCRKLGVSIKGTREVLIQKILDSSSSK